MRDAGLEVILEAGHRASCTAHSQETAADDRPGCRGTDTEAECWVELADGPGCLVINYRYPLGPEWSWSGERMRAAPLEIGDILERLGAARRRCTYRALAGVLGVAAAEVGPLMGDRRPETSRVVSAKTGRPTGYAPDRIHPELETHPDVISGPEELLEFCRSGG